MAEPKTILITGASSGIGAALAAEYAAPEATLILTGRNEARLAEIAEACRALGANVKACLADVTDAAGMERIFADIPAPDLVIANAGVAAPDGQGHAEATRTIFSINIDGVVNTVLPALEQMRSRGQGQIAIVSSIAGFQGLASAPAYSASKAAVKSWGEGLRGRYRADGVRISVICPGFVESRMTADNSFRMPFLMDAPRAAKIIRRGLARDKGRIVFPWPMHLGVWLMTVLPYGLTDRITRRLPRKE